MSFEQFSHQPYIALVRYWLSIAKTPTPREKIEARMPAGYAALDEMERHLAERSSLVDARYSIADIGLYAYTHVAHEGDFDLARYPAIRGWLTRVDQQPCHIPITA